MPKALLTKYDDRSMTSEVGFSRTQRQRLVELGEGEQCLEMRFESESIRNDYFNSIGKELSKQSLRIFDSLRQEFRRPLLGRMSGRISNILIDFGFVEVMTPTILAAGLLKKMGIGEDAHLWRQVFWLDKGRCLRPMLAPNLYFLLARLQRLWPRPIRIFEIGVCWRKESKGGHHLEEFTMLNLVELGCDGDPQDRLIELVGMLMGNLGIKYSLVTESSQVYGTTTDVVCDGIEVASGAIGPHPLDMNWNIAEPWAGLGIGVERICMLTSGANNVQRVGRSLIYLDGGRLNV